MTIEQDAEGVYILRATEAELRTLQEFISAAIEIKESSGVYDDTDFLPVQLSIHCEEVTDR
jgi:hypothetical protein